ncbi:hypothetical protein ABZ461_20050 [Actinacidiphila glaucinigra]|uniref:hypothetical protein n=1 Tax=Actinacidiphila glaucinigra TaxID=235986 RepID=UPI0033D87493
MTHDQQPGEAAQDEAAQSRRARFGKLPDRIRPQDTFVETPATAPVPARDTFNPDEWLIRNVG